MFTKNLGLLLLVYSGIAALSHAGLQVSPTRLLLTDEERVANLSLRHMGAREGRYDIRAVFFRMKSDGTLEQVTDFTENERPAVKYVRFSPRRAILPPNQEQIEIIKIAAPKNLPDGEYRLHLLFQPTEDTEGDLVAKNAGKESGIGMTLEAKISVAIPIIYRHGKTSFDVTLSQLSLTKMPEGASGFSLKMKSSGNGFPFGDLIATFIPEKGEPLPVGKVRGVGSYLPERQVTYPLNLSEKTQLSNGKLRVEFREPEQGGTPGKILHWAETKID